MKKFLFASVIAMTIASINCYSLGIDTIVVSPANPNSNDTIKVLVQCSFPSGGCDPYLVSLSPVGNDFYASALHCLGMLSVICLYTDTFLITPLTPGNYKFHMQLNEGGGPAPCTPGIAPGPVDSIAFTVTVPAGIISPPKGDSFSIIPDSHSGALLLEVPEILTPDKNILRVFSSEGRLVLETKITQAITRIHTNLSPGIYFASLILGDTHYQKKFVIIK